VDIFILRHGEAGKPFTLSMKEFERPLTQVGKKEVQLIAESLEDWAPKFDRILTSPLARAKETASMIAKTLKIQSRLEDCNELKPEGNRTELYKILSKMKHQTSILLVGHEPYLSMMIGDIVAGNPSSHIDLKKCGIAKIRISNFSPRVSGELKWLLTPKQIRKIR
jgi:phosphohistidine phosphatase